MLATTGNNVCGRRLYACINTRKFKGLDSREITSLPEIKKVITWHVISIIAENKPHAHRKTHLPIWPGLCEICRKVCSVKWLTKLHVKKDLRDQQDSYQDRLVLFKVHLYLWQRSGGGGIGEVTLLSSTFVSWPTPPASVTSHSSKQEPRVGLCKLARDTTVIRTSEVEEKLRS